MKKLLIVLVVFLGMNMNAQMSLGGGLAYMNDAGVEINSEFQLADGMIAISPSLDYYFPGNDVTSFGINFDGHYNLGDLDAVNYYPIAGLNYYYMSFDIPAIEYGGIVISEAQSVSDGSIGFNLGFGASYALSDSMKLFGEARYVSNDYADDFGLAFGIMFNFGN